MSRKIKIQRAIKDLTQRDVAKILGISNRAYVAKENGKTSFTVDEAKKLLELFGVKFEELF